MRRLGVLLLLLLTATACTREGRVRVLGPEELPQDVYASPTPSPTAAPLRQVRVFFVRDDRLEAAVRTTESGADAPDFVLRALLAGPTPDETAAGLTTAIPPGAELLEVEVDTGLATVNLSKEFEASAEERLIVLRLAQVVYTVTELLRVDLVRFEIDGEPVSVIAEDGEPFEEVGRANYRRLGSPAETAVPAESSG